MRAQTVYLRRLTPARIVVFAAGLVLMVAAATTSLPLPQQLAVTIGAALVLTWLASAVIRRFWKAG
jgi:hypothetical protein